MSQGTQSILEEEKEIKEKESYQTRAPVESVIIPPDGGWGWVVVFASFFASLILDGVIYAFSPYLEVLRLEFDAPRSRIAWIGSLTTGCAFLSGPLVSALSNRFGLRQVCIGGALLSSLAMLSTLFANSIEYLMITQGVLAGIGFGSIYLPCIVTVGIYFDKKRTLANGIAVCGSSVGSFVFPPLINYLINEYGWKGANLIVSGIILNCCWLGGLMRPLQKPKCKKFLLDEEISPDQKISSIAIDPNEELNCDAELLKNGGEMPSSFESTNEKDIILTKRQKYLKKFRGKELKERILKVLDFSLFKDLTFLMVSAAHFCAFLAFYTPFMYLPAAAMQKGIDQNSATFLVSIIGITNTLGRVASGWFATFPGVNPLWVHNLCLMSAGTALIFTRFADTYASFACIACSFGLAMSAYMSLTSPILVNVFGLDKLSSAFGFIILFWGISSLIGSPLSAKISEMAGTFDASFYYSGSLFWACALLFCMVPLAQKLRARKSRHLDL